MNERMNCGWQGRKAVPCKARVNGGTARYWESWNHTLTDGSNKSWASIGGPQKGLQKLHQDDCAHTHNTHYRYGKPQPQRLPAVQLQTRTRPLLAWLVSGANSEGRGAAEREGRVKGTSAVRRLALWTIPE